MYRWYELATVCYVFLPDVEIPLEQYYGVSEDLQVATAPRSPSQEPASQSSATQEDIVVTGRTQVNIHESCWFTRGWTLQELLAPSNMIFYDQHYEEIGTKDTLAPQLATITGIDEDYLPKKCSTRHASVAYRMSWASNRTTTRIEDTAYCLLGLFDINMPLLYGEGIGAFQRLQEAIMENSDDPSIFAWKAESSELRGLLARPPKEFTHARHIRRTYSQSTRAYTKTNKGILVETSIVPVHFWRWMTGADITRVSHHLSEPHFTVVLPLDCEETQFDGSNPRPLLILLGHQTSQQSGWTQLVSWQADMQHLTPNNYYRVGAASVVSPKHNAFDKILCRYGPTRAFYINQPPEERGGREASMLWKMQVSDIPSAYGHRLIQHVVLDVLMPLILLIISRHLVYSPGSEGPREAALLWIIYTLGFHYTGFKTSYCLMALFLVLLGPGTYNLPVIIMVLLVLGMAVVVAPVFILARGYYISVKGSLKVGPEREEVGMT